MFRNFRFGPHEPVPRFLNFFRMSKNSDKIYYAVGRGREIGIYNSWLECKAQIDGISNAKYRKFFSLPEAEEFVRFWKDYSSPSKNSKYEISVSNFSKNGSNFKRRSDSGFVKRNSKNTVALGLVNTLEKSESIALQPYVSPIPLKLQSQFRDNIKNQEKNVNSQKREKMTMPARKQNTANQSYHIGTSASLKTDDKFVLLEYTNNNGSGNSGPVQSVGNTRGSSQSANATSEPVIKKEVLEEEENDGDMSEVSKKLPKTLKILELAVNGMSRENNAESAKIKNIIKEFLEKIVRTNYRVNPQMESGESEKILEEPKPTEEAETRTEEPTQSQQPTALLSLPDASSSSPSRKSIDEKNAEVLALNLRLDSFEKRFDSCLKEIGGIVSEMSQIKAEIREIKETLSQVPSCSSPKKGKDGMLQTSLTFGSPNKAGGSRLEYSSRAYSTDPGMSGGETEFKSNRGKKRRLSRSNSSEGSKRFSEDNSEDILSRIKTEKVDYTSFCLDENDFVEVYTDGACHYNGDREAKAGIGIWFGDSHPLNVSEPVIGSATNNVAEIQAARIAIELAVKAGVKKLKVLTDSEFLINCVTKWMQRWKKNGWTLVRGGSVKNRKELEKLDKAASKICVRWEKVLAHSGIKGNEMADRLANQGAEKYSR